ncbi:lipopolysaccharide biosynthesis protein [Nonomuraea sp. NPDC059023]|uniref:lipopolysaccharide biosynthesis protein n=1 Tax=unclassified Nonomuraea TaxID=2593643 RepID=UPI00368EDDAA
MGRALRTTIRAAFPMMAAEAVKTALGIVAGAALARALHPEGRGLYAAIVSIATTAVLIGHWSLNTSQIAFWPHRVLRARLAGNAVVIGFGMGTITALLAFAAAAACDPRAATPALAIALASVPFTVCWLNLRGVLLLRGRTRLVNQAQLASGFAQYLPILALAAFDLLTLTAVVACWAAASVPAVLRFTGALGARALRPARALAVRQLALSGRYHLGLVAFHLLPAADTLLLGFLHSPREAGFYTVAAGVLMLVKIPTEAVAHVCLPGQAGGTASGSRAVTAHMLTLNLVISLGCVALIAAGAACALPFVYGPPYAASVAPLLALAPAAVMAALIKPVEQHLARLSRPRPMTMITLSALALNLGLDTALIPAWGATGAGVASSVTHAVTAALMIAWFVRSPEVNRPG